MSEKHFHVCSARQCTEVARWAVIWSNPKIHAAREKTWLACEGHRDFLTEFVSLRSFPHRVVPISEVDSATAPAPKPVDPRSLTEEERASLGEDPNFR
ncbi:hypothetical protein [Actinomyces sp.]|uniref:hypothetical protein n=1 Tax=Actinomyces sp. TaxID=29317 RepID=UPI002908A099|nr:hypothetical protein [Actinomyces sp.]MDU7238417.1 hypothetical protein [Actinomyces sp.]